MVANHDGAFVPQDKAVSRALTLNRVWKAASTAGRPIPLDSAKSRIGPPWTAESRRTREGRPLAPSAKRNIFNYLCGLFGGAEGNRTPDLCSAIAALSHLSYGPEPLGGAI